MNNNFDIKNTRFSHKGAYYICDFNVHFEVVNPKDDIYLQNGEPAPDRGQDEVNFTHVIIKSALLYDSKTSAWISIQDQGVLAEICESCLDWCRDTPDIHIEAFKHYKGHK